MPISIIDNFTVNTTKNIDSRLGPYSSIEEATSSISPLLRYVGMTLIITGSGNPVEYWFSPTINNNDLILKSPLTSSNAISASYAQTASFVQNAVSASYVLNTISSSYSATTSLAPNYVLNSVTASMLQPYVLTSQTSSMTVATASYVVNAQSASYVLNAVSASYALTASFAPAYVLNSLTSSFVNSSQTSSMIVGTASLALRGSGSFIGNFTGSLLGTASWALNAQTASFLPVGTYDITSSWSQNSNQALTASYVLNAISSSYSLTSQTANTASYILNAISASYAATAALAPNYILISTTSSMLQPYVLTSQTSSMTVATASYVLNAVSSSFTINAQTASLPLQGIITASASNTTITFTKGDGSVFNVTVSQSGSVASASYALFAQNSATASYITSSNVYGPYGSDSILSASYAQTSSYAINFNVSGSLTASGLIYPVVDNGEESFIQTNGAGVLSFQYVKTVYENIYNGELTTITKGTPLYVSGAVGDNAVVYRADASVSSKMPVIYISADNIASGAIGRGIALGLINGVNTTGYPPGTEIYVAPGGGWTSTRPTGSSIIQILGYVTKEGNGGKGVVLNPGPASLPNLTSGSIWVGNSNSVPIILPTSSLNVNSASYALSSSYSQTSSYSISASFASTASLAPNYVLNNATASMLQPYVLTSQTSSMSVATASYVLNAISSSFAINAQTASFLPTGTYNITSSWAISSSQATSASWAANGGVTQIIAGTNITISPTGGSGSVTINSTGGGVSFPYTGSAEITGSLVVIGPITSTDGFSGSFSGSFFGNGAGLTGITATADTTAIEAQVWFLT